MSNTKASVYDVITDRIIAELQKNRIPWRKPWVGIAGKASSKDCAVSYSTGKPYSLFNQILLPSVGEYATFKQVQAAGGRVNKGAKSHTVVFWKMLFEDEKDADGNAVINPLTGKPAVKKIPVLRYYQVFHLSDTTLSPKCENVNVGASGVDTFQAAEDVITDYIGREGVKYDSSVRDRAFYRPATDEVKVPSKLQFDSQAEFYSTIFHELTHSTGHKSRLNRFADDTKLAAFGSPDYSKEELVAEIGSAASLHRLGIETPDSFQNSTAYIQGWLTALSNDNRMLVGASSRAAKAVDLIFGCAPEPEPEQE